MGTDTVNQICDGMKRIEQDRNADGMVMFHEYSFILSRERE